MLFIDSFYESDYLFLFLCDFFRSLCDISLYFFLFFCVWLLPFCWMTIARFQFSTLGVRKYVHDSTEFGCFCDHKRGAASENILWMCVHFWTIIPYSIIPSSRRNCLAFLLILVCTALSIFSVFVFCFFFSFNLWSDAEKLKRVPCVNFDTISKLRQTHLLNQK